MADYLSTKVNLVNLLNQLSSDRALAIADQIVAGQSRLLRREMTLDELSVVRWQAPTSAEQADIKYLMEVVSAAAVHAVGGSVGHPLADYYNPDLLEITYIALNKDITLPGALLSFDDNYRPSFRREEVYGRMDPIATYQGTGRTIGLEWEMNLASADYPEQNLAAFQDLIKFMYPVYQDTTFNQLGTGTLVAPPVLRIEIQDGGGAAAGLMQGYNKGLLCIVDNFSYSRFTASRTAGDINIVRRARGAPDAESAVLRPSHLTISLALTVLHEEAKVGFVYSKVGEPGNEEVKVQFGQGEGYPYGFGSTLDLANIPQNPRIQRLAGEVIEVLQNPNLERQVGDAMLEYDATVQNALIRE